MHDNQKKPGLLDLIEYLFYVVQMSVSYLFNFIKQEFFILFILLIVAFFTYYKDCGFDNKGANLIMTVSIILFAAIYRSTKEVNQPVVVVHTSPINEEAISNVLKNIFKRRYTLKRLNKPKEVQLIEENVENKEETVENKEETLEDIDNCENKKKRRINNLM